ncbi:hypothetical protein KY285_025900 [Solanum tuberosum]|nr:hypothetical protein KY285_025900 [Solanum tuberosum]
MHQVLRTWKGKVESWKNEKIMKKQTTHHHSYKSDATMMDEQLDFLLLNLYHLSKHRAEKMFPGVTQYEVLQNICGNIRDFHGLIVNGCMKHEMVENVLPQFQLMAERVGHFLWDDQTDEDSQLSELDEDDQNDRDSRLFKLAHLLLKIVPTELEVMHICYTNLKASTSAEVGRFIKKLLETSPDILREYLIHLQEHMITVITPSTSGARNIHVMMEFLLIILSDMPKDFIHHDKLFDLLACVGALTREVSTLVRDLEEKLRNKEGNDQTNRATLDLLENIELLKEDLKHVYLKVPNSSQCCFPMSDGPLFMHLLHIHLNDLLDSNAYSIAIQWTSRSGCHFDHWYAGFSHFDLRAWCTVDQGYDEKKLLNKIFNQVSDSDSKLSENIDVADKLQKQLYGKRYLIVLDDVWDTTTWDELTRPFPVVVKGSRIILTTREKEVALHGKLYSAPLNLRLLRPEESWELLEKRAFGNESCPDDLLGVGKEIAENCKGLPLVADLIAGVIAGLEKKKTVWLEVRNNLSSFILNGEVEVMKVIELSYDHLPHHIKPCFLYLASFPKDTAIVIFLLNSLWHAEGLVEQTEMKSVEEVMDVYIDNLISSSLVILFNEIGDDRTCQVHDLVHDF